MALFYSIGLLFLTKFCIAQSDQSDEIDTVGLNAANEVYNEIFNVRGYNRFLSPISTRKTNSSGGSKTTKLNIHFDLWYIKLISLDAQSQMLSICLELKTYW
ncbi:unnamed protein product, partial [Mesorhabditis belari]|uniref:Uncharacterized protein n=1 Tax=Mesorhabditis belari TaxID=2138241 RepID=A0AAF3EJN3_9BILA